MEVGSQSYWDPVHLNYWGYSGKETAWTCLGDEMLSEESNSKIQKWAWIHIARDP